jgi:hypothetical protein
MWVAQTLQDALLRGNDVLWVVGSLLLSTSPGNVEMGDTSMSAAMQLHGKRWQSLHTAVA